MLRSQTLLSLICALLLLVSTAGASPGSDRMDSRELLLLDAVKMGILSSLGMDQAPSPNRRASQQELRRIYKLYRETVRELRGNSSRGERTPQRSIRSTVLFPVSPVKVVHQVGSSDGRVWWYRAAFQTNLTTLDDLSLTRAELKISGELSGSPDVKIRVNGAEAVNSATHNTVASAMSLNISPEVRGWTAGEELVVEVGSVEVLKRPPAISVKLFLTRRTRPRRSIKEESCDEWCCRRSLSVSFKELGWSDWVLAPDHYTMHFCDGGCPHNYKAASMHTQVKWRLHQLSKGATPRPCCVPAAYQPMVLMHYDSRGKIKLTPFNDLIVTKCHCA